MAFDKSVYLMQSEGVNNKNMINLSGGNKNVNESHVNTYNDYQQQHLIGQISSINNLNVNNSSVNNKPINVFRRVENVGNRNTPLIG